MSDSENEVVLRVHIPHSADDLLAEMRTPDSVWHTQFPPGFVAAGGKWAAFANDALGSIRALPDLIQRAREAKRYDTMCRYLALAVTLITSAFHQRFPLTLDHVATECDGADECSVCDSTATEAEWVCINKCRHKFHKSCLASWLDMKKFDFSCPRCRASPFDSSSEANSETNSEVVSD